MNTAAVATSRAACSMRLELVDGKAPEWVQLLPAGTFRGRDGRGPWFADIPAILDAFASDQRAGIEPVFDYDHQTMLVQQTGQKAPAAGWVKELQERNEEVWGRVEWTAAAAERIEKKEWRYSSPVFDFHPNGRVVFIVSVGLNNTPNLFLRALNALTHGVTNVDLNELLEPLGLPATADKTAVLEAIKVLKASGTDLQTALNSLRQATGADATATLQTVANSVLTGFVPKAEYERVANALAQQQAGAKDSEIDQVLDAAIQAGKIAPASRGYFRAQCAADMTAFRQFVASAPVIAAAADAQRAANAKGDNGHHGGDNSLIADAKARAAQK
ncbi:hypothetical protein HA052_22810 [Chromobacterium haemolyticum]|uniref:Mu-like prophage I protein n=2 Tax=Chromobacterium fluminis TaxID=3044269 RepID=A0ABX0LHT5_9NEIS|nr:hypothetical protein [Chromobacterium haemolyticum]